MTTKQIYRNILVELNKKEAPSVLLLDFLYFLNKGIHQYTNKAYNKCEMNQQSDDDLSALKRSIKIELTKNSSSSFLSNHYIGELPNDYMHIMKCIIEYDILNNKCNTLKTKYKANRLTSDMHSSIINNAYLCPMYKRPYFFVLNLESSNNLFYYKSTNEKSILSKLGIVCGEDPNYIPKNAYIDYIKTPNTVNLTEDQIEELEDNSQELEFSEYVCYEIINDVVKLLLENFMDPRLQTNIPINQTIAIPGQK